MAQFNREQLELFLAAVRKYMQLRGVGTQKELAEMCDIGVSTMSRFLNQQTRELSPQLISKITAKLNIPLHEIIDFVEEDYTDQFIRLVKFHKGEEVTPPASEGTGTPGGGSEKTATAPIKVGGKTRTMAFAAEGDGGNDLREKMMGLSGKQRAFVMEFFNLDSDGRDLVADVGRNIISYLRQKGIDF